MNLAWHKGDKALLSPVRAILSHLSEGKVSFCALSLAVQERLTLKGNVSRHGLCLCSWRRGKQKRHTAALPMSADQTENRNTVNLTSNSLKKSETPAIKR